MPRPLIPYTYLSASVWSDPVFTGLSANAQVLWMYRVTGNRSAPYTTYADAAADVTRNMVEAAAAELAATPYGIVLAPVRRQRFTPNLRERVLEGCDWRCVQCKSTDDLCIDHIRPVALGGTNDLDNLQVLCRPCNSRKGARYDGAR